MCSREARSSLNALIEKHCLPIARDGSPCCIPFLVLCRMDLGNLQLSCGYTAICEAVTAVARGILSGPDHREEVLVLTAEPAMVSLSIICRRYTNQDIWAYDL